MKTKKLLGCLAALAMMPHASAQVAWDTNGNPVNTTEWFGADGGAHGWVYDAGGCLVAQFAFNGSSEQPIGHWPEGVYVLRVQAGSGSVGHEKFVVMR